MKQIKSESSNLFFIVKLTISLVAAGVVFGFFNYFYWIHGLAIDHAEGFTEASALIQIQYLLMLAIDDRMTGELIKSLSYGVGIPLFLMSLFFIIRAAIRRRRPGGAEAQGFDAMDGPKF